MLFSSATHLGNSRTSPGRSRSELHESFARLGCNKRARKKGRREIAEQKRYPLAMGADLTYYSAMGKVRRQFFLERRSSHGTGFHALRWDRRWWPVMQPGWRYDVEPYQEPHPLGVQCSSPGSVPR